MSTEQELDRFFQENLHEKMQEEAKIIADTLLVFKNFYPGSKIDDNGLLLYALFLVRDNYCAAEVRMAMEKLVKTSTFYPSLSEIIGTIKSIESTATGIRTKTVDEAWAEVFSEIRRCSIYREPVFSSQEIADTVKNLGWSTLVNMPSSSISVVRSQFEKYYVLALRRREEREENVWLMHLAGNDAARVIADRVAKKRSIIAALERQGEDLPGLEQITAERSRSDG